ncbi:hypothetical protein E1A91_D05G061300v1 [Gossypium mustelinum]|uniref:Uncharacterized protein n=5 Tax=Gossypium TaxID=3633 RepID=A0A5J5RA09_GOSBA|nr:hypothetical protein ES319_D05G057600v1 [Gossypium barbadense]TYG67228.1 hypothetical protein ES288_D05G061500v1 [Gossypium darwinii]TYH69531.1 hypothetical protein ES332_D05G063000v1 [Gossypium tomentosum]TYI80005.1 hypothetical protein E1A91_D05G061300v1 [Gossypium mustelinum]
MSKVTQMESLTRNDGFYFSDSLLGFALQAMVVESAIIATKSVAWLLMMMGSLPDGIDSHIKEPEAYTGFPLAQLHAVRKPSPENKDACDTEDDEDEDEKDEAGDDQDEDADEEDASGEDEGDPEDEPEANGDGASGDEDDDDEDDDDDDDDDGEEEEEEEEEEDEDEEEELQPPAKKRK